MIPHNNSGAWEKVDQRARKILRRGNMRRRRKDQGSGHQLRRPSRLRIRYAFTILRGDGPLSRQSEEGFELAEKTLRERRNLDRVRRKQARHHLMLATTLKFVRCHRGMGGYAIIPSSTGQDFWLPLREEEWSAIDSWRWIEVMQYEPWQQKLLLEIIDIYSGLCEAKLAWLMRHGEVVYDSPRVGRILIEIKGQSFSATALDPSPSEKVGDATGSELDDGQQEMHSTWEEIGATTAA